MLFPITVDGTACLLLTAEPDRAGALQTTCKHLIQREVGLSNREHRRAYSAALRWTLKFSARLNLAEGRALRAALRGSDNEPILCPFWPAAGLVTDAAAAPLVGGLKVTWEPDWSAYELHTGTAAGSYSAAAFTAPVLWARWDKPPEPVAESDERGDVAFALVENGPAEYAIGPRSTATIAGPVIGGAARPLLAEHCDYGRDLASGGIDLRIARETIGYGRAEAEEYVSQSPRSTGSFYFKGDAEAAMRLVALFHASRGSAGTIWWPAAHAEWRLAADVTTAAVQLESARAPVAPHPDYLALRKTDGTLVARRISAIEGATLTLDSAPGAFARHSTTLLPLFLGRFNTTELKLDWTKPRAITADIPLIELPTETALPTCETVGTTIGDLGTPIWLYHVSDGDLDWYYTSFESEIDAGALGIFEPRPIDHGDITSEINLQRHDCDLTVGWFAGSPFERARLDRLAPQLTVQIYEGKLSAPSAAEIIFTGKAAGYQFQGGKCTCKIAGPTALFDVRGPVAVTSPRCWTPMYSSLCGLSREALSVEASLLSIGDDGTCLFDFGGSVAYLPPDHFRYGYGERRFADGSRRRYPCVGSASYRQEIPIPELPSSLQPETVTWQAAAIGAGGTIDADSLAIADSLVVQLKALSSWPKLVYFLPLLGANAAAACAPLVDHAAAGMPTRFNIGDGDYSLAAGLKGDGQSKILHLPHTPATLGVNGAGGLGYWELGWDTSGSAFENPMGCNVTAAETVYEYRLRIGPVQQGFGWGYAEETTAFLPETLNGNAHWYGQSSSPAARSVYRNGALAAVSTAPTALNGQTAAIRLLGILGHLGADKFWAGRCGCAYLTDGTLTAEEVADLNGVLLDFMLMTGRVGGGQGMQFSKRPSEPALFPEPGWLLVPGCDHSWARCKALGNSANFRGCPHFPKSNPAMVSVKQETSSGSKK